MNRKGFAAALTALIAVACGGGSDTSAPAPTPTPAPALTASSPTNVVPPPSGQPYAFYIDAMADWASAGHGVPLGLAAYPVADQPGAFAIELTVTGAAGAKTLTVSSGPLAAAAGNWAAVIRHDDGSYGTYAIAGRGPGTLLLRTPLRGAVTNGPLQNLHAGQDDQHYSPLGYQGLNEHIWRYPTWRAYRGDVVAVTTETERLTDKWWLNGMRPVRISAGNLNYALDPPAGNANATPAVARNTWQHTVDPSAAHQSIEWSVNLGGTSGYVDTYLAAAGAQTQPAKIEIFIDNQLAAAYETFGLERIAYRYANAQLGKIKITFPEGNAAASFNWRLGRTTWYRLPADFPTSETLFWDGAKVQYLGDSWGEYYGGIGPAVLGQHVSASGGSFLNSSMGGQTSRWARENFASLVLAYDPDILVVQFFTNDNNAGFFASGEWLANMRWLIEECQKHGIRPVVVLPTSVAGLSQSQVHAQMASALVD